ncbi:MAG: PorT family protein [Bacteroidales bacterium]|nr:PorT family protein [Bacteroidales bacterium]
MKRIAFIILFLLITVGLDAQEITGNVSTQHSNVKGGARIGMTCSQISGDNLTGYHQPGVYAGLYVTFPLSQNWKWMVQPELNFNMKGSRTYFPKGLSEGSQTYSLRLMYLEIPVVFKWNFWKGFLLEAGPSFNINVFHQEKFDGDVDHHVQPFRWYEFAGLVGLSYIFKGHYAIFFRYSGSFIPVRVPNNVMNRLQKKQYNDVMMFGFYYQFN